jgi:hypothetical protein
MLLMQGVEIKKKKKANKPNPLQNPSPLLRHLSTLLRCLFYELLERLPSSNLFRPAHYHVCATT